MLETTVARLLQAACPRNDQEKEEFVLCEVIFNYIVSHPVLGATEKLTWLVINQAVQHHPIDLTCHLSYRMIANAMNVSKDTAYRVVRVLKAQHFLLASSDNSKKVRYTTNLPQEGIALLKQALQDKKKVKIASILTRLLRHYFKNKEVVSVNPLESP